jgi:hypothetical protein
MTLYNIDARLVMLLNEHFDIEDGVIYETEEELAKKIDEVSLDLNTKISNIGCFVKNLLSDAEQLKAEKQNLEKRQKQAERKAEYLKNYLDGYLHSVINEKDLPKYKFSDSRCQISYRKSEAVEITDLDKVPKKFIKDRVLKETDVDKAEIKKLLKADSNTEIEGTQLVVRENIQIK